MASRILGFVRDIMIAATLGAGPVAEAFLIAFTLPNMFRRFFAEGAFNMAFIPMFSKRLETADNPKGFAQDALSALTAMLVGFSLLAHLAMPWLVLAMASGFAGDDRFELATQYGRIAFPYIILISLAALFSGILNATGRFSAAAAAPLLLNIIFIAAMVLAPAVGLSTGLALACAVPLAGIAQLALVWRAAASAGFRLVPRKPRLTPELKQLAIIAFPAMLAGGVVQINLIVGRQVASFFDGAIAWLSYADRLYQLPLGVVGIAIGVVLLPELSRRLAAGDGPGGRAALNRAAEWSMALTLPAAAALIVIPVPLISVLFERSAFSASDTAATAAALAIYGAGLPAFVLQKVLQPAFFARGDTKSPFRYALAALFINAALAVGLMSTIGYLAAAIGTTVAAWAMALLLWNGARKMGDAAKFDDRLKSRLPRIVLTSVAMALILWAAAPALSGWLATPGVRYAALAVLVGLGILSYAAIGNLIGAFSYREFRAEISRTSR